MNFLHFKSPKVLFFGEPKRKNKKKNRKRIRTKMKEKVKIKIKNKKRISEVMKLRKKSFPSVKRKISTNNPSSPKPTPKPTNNPKRNPNS